jgi:hypothetical protein
VRLNVTAELERVGTDRGKRHLPKKAPPVKAGLVSPERPAGGGGRSGLIT